ncbi:alkylmercury lyase family protein [Streptomyces wedmorensis]|uniref:Alkylmercury lyase family protein n=1 Tax=Streptomyces wedmorensis TaxID=43759 RepID=A0ABW6J377_STRWE
MLIDERAALGARRCGQQARLFVEADRLALRPRLRGELSDAQTAGVRLDLPARRKVYGRPMHAPRITVLTVPDCPNAPLALERITAALDGREADVELVEVRDEAEASRWGMTGSPTVLLNGADPFAVPGAPVSVSCRLYRDEEGRAAGAPGVEALRKALALDAEGTVRAAYPFSAVETPHRVKLGNGVEAWSMCAIDALGVAAMLDQDIQVTSADPVSGHPVAVSFISGSARWEPAGAVVFVGRRPGQGPAADVCCDALNFFADRSTAETWARRHPDVPGRITGQAEAVVLAAQTFGPLLAED